MGRTGRQRDGKIVYLLSEKDKRKLASSTKSKLTSGRLLVNGAKNFRLYEESPRMVPRGTELEVERRKIQAVTPMKCGAGAGKQQKRKADAFLTASQDQTYRRTYAASGTPQVYTFNISSADLSYSGVRQPTKLATHSRRTEVLIDTLANIEHAVDNDGSQAGMMMDLSAYLDPRDVCDEYVPRNSRRPVNGDDGDNAGAAGPALEPPKGKKARRREPDPNALYNESSSSACDTDSDDNLPSLEPPAERKKQTAPTIRGNTNSDEAANNPTGGEEEEDGNVLAEMDDSADDGWDVAMPSEDNDAGAPLDAETDAGTGAVVIAVDVRDQQRMLQGGADTAQQPPTYIMGNMTLHRTWTPVPMPAADVFSVISELRKLGRRQSLGLGPTNALDQLSVKSPVITSAAPAPASTPLRKRDVQSPGAVVVAATLVLTPSSMVSAPVANPANPFKAPIGISPFKPKLVKRPEPQQQQVTAIAIASVVPIPVLVEPDSPLQTAKSTAAAAAVGTPVTADTVIPESPAHEEDYANMDFGDILSGCSESSQEGAVHQSPAASSPAPAAIRLPDAAGDAILVPDSPSPPAPKKAAAADRSELKRTSSHETDDEIQFKGRVKRSNKNRILFTQQSPNRSTLGEQNMSPQVDVGARAGPPLCETDDDSPIVPRRRPRPITNAAIIDDDDDDDDDDENEVDGGKGEPAVAASAAADVTEDDEEDTGQTQFKRLKKKRIVCSPSPRGGSTQSTQVALQYEVKTIKGERFIGGNREYLVAWFDHPTQEDTWEPEEQLAGCDVVVKQYYAGHQKLSKPYGKGKKRATPRQPMGSDDDGDGDDRDDQEFEDKAFKKPAGKLAMRVSKRPKESNKSGRQKERDAVAKGFLDDEASDNESDGARGSDGENDPYADTYMDGSQDSFIDDGSQMSQQMSQSAPNSSTKSRQAAKSPGDGEFAGMNMYQRSLYDKSMFSESPAYQGGKQKMIFGKRTPSPSSSPEQGSFEYDNPYSPRPIGPTKRKKSKKLRPCGGQVEGCEPQPASKRQFTSSVEMIDLALDASVNSKGCITPAGAGIDLARVEESPEEEEAEDDDDDDEGGASAPVATGNFNLDVGNLLEDSDEEDEGGEEGNGGEFEAGRNSTVGDDAPPPKFNLDVSNLLDDSDEDGEGERAAAAAATDTTAVSRPGFDLGAGALLDDSDDSDDDDDDDNDVDVDAEDEGSIAAVAEGKAAVPTAPTANFDLGAGSLLDDDDDGDDNDEGNDADDFVGGGKLQTANANPGALGKLGALGDLNGRLGPDARATASASASSAASASAGGQDRGTLAAKTTAPNKSSADTISGKNLQVSKSTSRATPLSRKRKYRQLSGKVYIGTQLLSSQTLVVQALKNRKVAVEIPRGGVLDHMVLSVRLGLLICSPETLTEPKTIKRCQELSQLFDLPYLVVQKDPRKDSRKMPPVDAHGLLSGNAKYETTLVKLVRFKVNLLFSDSVDETADLIWELASGEITKSFGLPPILPPATEAGAHANQVAKLLLRVPGINFGVASTLAASELAESFESLVNAKADALEKAAPALSAKKAASIARFFRRTGVVDELPRATKASK